MDVVFKAETYRNYLPLSQASRDCLVVGRHWKAGKLGPKGRRDKCESGSEF